MLLPPSLQHRTRSVAPRGGIHRHTMTGMVEWVRTLVVSLPSSKPSSPLRPCEAITMRSHSFDAAALMIASHGAAAVTTSDATSRPAPFACAWIELKILAAYFSALS